MAKRLNFPEYFICYQSVVMLSKMACSYMNKMTEACRPALDAGSSKVFAAPHYTTCYASASLAEKTVESCHPVAMQRGVGI